MWLPFVGTLLGALIGGGFLLIANAASAERQAQRDREARREAQLYERQRRRVSALLEVQDLANTGARQLGDLNSVKTGELTDAYKAAWVDAYATRSAMMSKAVQVEDPQLREIVSKFDDGMTAEDTDQVSARLAEIDQRVSELLPLMEDPAVWMEPDQSP